MVTTPPFLMLSSVSRFVLRSGVALTVGVGLFSVNAAHATPSTGTASGTTYPALQVCDPDYYTTLEQKAWMEVQREIQVNQTVITKPASTLALSCFDYQLSQAASAGGTFSNTTNGSLTQNAINTAIGNSFTQFYSENFADPPEMAGTKFGSNGTYNTCSRLNTIWATIKCGTADPAVNYLKPLDFFRTSASSGTDIRDTKGSANCKASTSTLATEYTKSMVATTDLDAGKTAYGTTYFDKAAPDFCAYNPKTGDDALANAYICQVKNATGSATTPKNCDQMNAVPVGTVVSYTQKVGNIEANTPVWSYACLNPGCYFDVSANFSKIKFASNASPPSGLKCSYKPYVDLTKSNTTP